MDKFPKYTKSDIFCTTEGKFADVDVGNLFIIGGDLYIRINYPARRQYARNAAIICSEDPGMCGIGLYIDSHDDVEIVTESHISLRGSSRI